MYDAASAEPQLTVLDVGHGNSAVYSEGDSIAILDCGIGETLADYLTENERSHVDIVFISHSHEDHLRGILRVLEALPHITFGTIYVNPAQKQESDVWASFATEIIRLESSGSKVVTALTRSFPGNLIHESATFEVMHPPPSEVLKDNKDNRLSAVIRLVVDQQPVAIFCADVDSVGWQTVLNYADTLHAKILVFPHHGGRSGKRDNASFAQTVLEAVSPEMVLFSIGRNRHKNPRPEIVRKVREYNPSIKVACTQLSKKCSASLQFNRNLITPSAGAEFGSSCSGTLRFDLPLNDDWRSSRHGDFVETLVLEGQRPMCVSREKLRSRDD